MKTLTFNGKCTNEFGIVIQEPPVYDFPEKDYEIQHVPGRTGDIVVDLGSYKNTQRTYNLVNIFTNEGTAIFPWKSGTTPLASDFITRAKAMVKWFIDAKGYCRLEDDYEPDVYRKAMYYAGGSFANLYDQGTAIQATFECKPQRFYKVGSEPNTYESGEVFIIDSTHKNEYSYPFIKFNSSTSFNTNVDITFKSVTSATVDRYTFSFTNLPNNTTEINIDWENKIVYNNDNVVLNNNLIIKDNHNPLEEKILDDFPENIFVSDEDELVHFNGTGLRDIKITYNWWYI